MKFQASRPATLLKSDSSKGVFQWIVEGFLEYLQTAASELVRYLAHVFLSVFRLEEEKYIKII